jgi:signal transduction histidine kinase
MQLDEILQWCVEHTQQVADERKITTVTDLPPVQIMGNQDHLKMLFTNIIFNAINYSENEGQVRVSLFNSNQQVIVEVEDQGIGIAGDKLPKIFDEYFRTETAVKHNQDSTGLGLSIVCGVVRKYQLELTVESEVNMGTLFRIEFPTKN